MNRNVLNIPLRLLRLNRVAVIAACMLAASTVAAQPPTDFSAVEIEILHVQDNVYALFGAGGNTTVQIGTAGVLVVDSQYAQMSDKLLAAIRTLSERPIRYIINTHAHGDHIGGNEALIAAGATVTGGNVTPDVVAQADFARSATVMVNVVCETADGVAGNGDGEGEGGRRHPEAR